MAKTMGEALTETYLNSKQAKATATLSLFLAIAALIASGVSAYYAFQDSKTDNEWQMQQIKTLEYGVELNAEQSKN